ncbi:MadR family response regulator transcription factor [Fodinicola acaciae]|uniref:MadR family response regulator transcription factor n=1 Tax=Fodinicola acaciae TaxID=2681555 RepID=UPI0013D15AE4|nr:response regulator transcription factor [Fodinicola acaciae]
MSDQIRIALVDDHAIVRQGLRSMLEREPGLTIVAEAASAPEALALINKTEPDIVLLDLKLSTGSDSEGLSLCRHIVAAHPDIGVLVLTTFIDERLVVASIQAGAKGYVVKDVDPTELVSSVRAVHRGESAFDAHAAAVVVKSLHSGGGEDRGRSLTERELEVLRLLAHGMSNVDIGKKLFISETTVKFHVSNVMRKLDVSRRAEAVYAASKLGLI